MSADTDCKLWHVAYGHRLQAMTCGLAAHGKEQTWFSLFYDFSCYGVNHQAKRELEFFIAHKEANFDLWYQSMHVFFICVSFLERGIHTLKRNVSMHE